jgi:hypothetical protein
MLLRYVYVRYFMLLHKQQKCTHILILVYLTSSCVNWVFFDNERFKGPQVPKRAIFTRTFFYSTSPLKAPNR